MFYVILVLLAVPCLAAYPLEPYYAPLVGTDTGAFRIRKYKVVLRPNAEGVVTIEYYQKWLVNRGHIRWVTIAVLGPEYEIVNFGLSAVKAHPQISDGSLVFLELDKDYQPGQSFEVSFSIKQHQLIHPDGSDYVLDFTPGWYDFAYTDCLEVRFVPLCGLSRVKANPPPSSHNDLELIWMRKALQMGDRYPISISFPRNSLSEPLPRRNLRISDSTETGLSFIVASVLLLLLGSLAAVLIYRSKVGGMYCNLDKSRRTRRRKLAQNRPDCKEDCDEVRVDKETDLPS